MKVDTEQTWLYINVITDAETGVEKTTSVVDDIQVMVSDNFIYTY